MIKCEICGKEFKQLNNAHLKTHNVTPQEYKKQFNVLYLADEDIRLKNKNKSEETRQKLRESKIEYLKDPNNRRNISEKKKGKPMNFSEEDLQRRRTLMKDHNPMHNDESKKKCIERMTETKKEHWNDQEYSLVVGKKLSEARKLNWQNTEYRDNVCNALKEVMSSDDVKTKLSEAQKELWKDSSYKEKMILIFKERGKRMWKEEDYRKAVFDGRNVQPNKFELRVQHLLDTILPNEYKYNGDYSAEFSIEGKIPDFVCLEKRKVIECNGTYWHADDDGSDRIALFHSHGFDTLIIWENQPFDENLIKSILLFHNCIN